jgi:hypothetical protein
VPTQNDLITATEAVSSAAIVSRREDVIACNLMEETVLLDLQSGIYFGLDPVGTRIWAMMGSPRRITDIHSQLLDEFDVDAETCERSVRQFLNELATKGLVQLTEG